MTEMITAVIPETRGRIISDPSLARKLIRSGFTVIDIKPKKNFPRESVYVFKVTNEFKKALDQFLKERAEKKAESKAETSEEE